jgi:hypothetical protein
MSQSADGLIEVSKPPRYSKTERRKTTAPGGDMQL